MLLDEPSGWASYLLADLDAAEAALIDPRADDLPVLRALLDEHALCLRWVLRTHVHRSVAADDAATLSALQAQPAASGHRGPGFIAVPPASVAPPVAAPAASWVPDAVQHSAPATSRDAQGHTLLALGNHHLQVLPTPGHTAGCLSFRWRDRLFCGGLLAVDACPHQPRPERPEALWHSVTQQVFTLPAETLLFAGHTHQGRAVSSVLEQRHWHPWFAGASRDDFLARVRTPARPSTVSA